MEILCSSFRSSRSLHQNASSAYEIFAKIVKKNKKYAFVHKIFAN